MRTGTKRLKSADVLTPVPRVGIGYDVHAFVSGRKFILGGVNIPFEFGLLGHSDADVLLHALCDALLGAASLGDIGKHFPNTSRTYKNISSLILIQRVGEMLTKHHWSIINLDATIMLQRPKVLKYSANMIRNIARSLGISAKRISIKATTNEGLGFIGRGEGCAVLAIATILPSRN